MRIFIGWPMAMAFEQAAVSGCDQEKHALYQSRIILISFRIYLTAMAKTSLSPAALRAYRLEVASRSLLAALGGYGLAALSASSLGLILPLSPLQAALTATMLAFVLYCVF